MQAGPDGRVTWLRTHANGVELSVYVQPGAKTTAIIGEHDGALKLRVAAPPVDGKANAAVVAFLAQQLGVASSRVTLISGDQHRRKRFRIDDIPAALAIERLTATFRLKSD